MTFDFRYPNITGATEREQLQQMKTYVHQLVDELKWALNAVDSSQGNYVVIQQPNTGNANNGIATMSLDELHEDSVQAHFNEIKPLIIKSAEIVNAYYEEINKRLESQYVAQSDFGTFVQQATQEIAATADNVTQVFSNVQTIATDVDALDTSIADVDKSVQSVDKNLWQLDNKLKDAKEGIDTSLKTLSDDLGQLDSGVKDLKDNVENELKDVKGAIDNIVYTLIEVNASIKSGLLYYDDNEIPIYGLEIGQRNIINGVEVFNKFARFTSDRLSFYDQNGIEVAYISDRKLYINDVEITTRFKIGGLVDTVMPNGDVVTKWIGRG